MVFELQMVVATSLILFVLLLAQGALVPLNQGLGWGLGSRDEPRDKSSFQARAARTVANHIEGMCLFVPLAIVVVLTDLSSQLTIWGAGLYVIGRLVFAPLYLLGVPYLRSLAWGISVIGILLIAYPAVTALG
ncbi:MAG: MAPEG family protein [Henriciella sp.]